MGVYAVATLTEPQQLHQILVPGLERARHLPPLMAISQLAPGYFDAPAAREAVLMALGKGRAIPPVTLVFTALAEYKEMRAENGPAAEIALTLCRDCLRKVLRDQRGYECQEQDGELL
eukprot:jgi/Astpho2/3990/Aster-x0182